ncbi:hypothetical protein ACFWBG_06705 [Nocardia salmonicida]
MILRPTQQRDHLGLRSSDTLAFGTTDVPNIERRRFTRILL